MKKNLISTIAGVVAVAATATTAFAESNNNQEKFYPAATAVEFEKGGDKQAKLHIITGDPVSNKDTCKRDAAELENLLVTELEDNDVNLIPKVRMGVIGAKYTKEQADKLPIVDHIGGIQISSHCKTSADFNKGQAIFINMKKKYPNLIEKWATQSGKKRIALKL